MKRSVTRYSFAVNTNATFQGKPLRRQPLLVLRGRKLWENPRDGPMDLTSALNIGIYPLVN